METGYWIKKLSQFFLMAFACLLMVVGYHNYSRVGDMLDESTRGEKALTPEQQLAGEIEKWANQELWPDTLIVYFEEDFFCRQRKSNLFHFFREDEFSLEILVDLRIGDKFILGREVKQIFCSDDKKYMVLEGR